MWISTFEKYSTKSEYVFTAAEFVLLIGIHGCICYILADT